MFWLAFFRYSKLSLLPPYQLIILFLLFMAYFNIVSGNNNLETKIRDVFDISMPSELSDYKAYLIPITYLLTYDETGLSDSSYLILCKPHPSHSNEWITQYWVSGLRKCIISSKVADYTLIHDNENQYSGFEQMDNTENESDSLEMTHSFLFENYLNSTQTPLNVISPYTIMTLQDPLDLFNTDTNCLLKRIHNPIEYDKWSILEFQDIHISKSNNIDIVNLLINKHIKTWHESCQGLLIVSDDGKGCYTCEFEAELHPCGYCNCKRTFLCKPSLEDHKQTCPHRTDPKITTSPSEFNMLPEYMGKNSGYIMTTYEEKNDNTLEKYYPLKINHDNSLTIKQKNQPISDLPSSSEHTKRTLATNKHCGRKLYFCKHCTKSFTRLRDLSTHNKRSLKCEGCKQRFICINKFKNHNASHKTNCPHTCKTCNQIFKTVESLKKHDILHDETKAFTCRDCKFHYKLKKDIINHIRPKIPNQEHKCEICDKIYKSTRDFNQHIRRAHEDRPYFCKDCKTSFVNNPKLTKHQKKTFVCSKCNKIFKCSNSYIQHGKVHSDIINALTCTICKKIFQNHKTLKRHSRSHKTTINSFFCHSCNEFFNNKDSLVDHTTKRISCFDCQMLFNCNNSYEEHIKNYCLYKRNL